MPQHSIQFQTLRTKRCSKCSRAFTLIEVLVVIAIIALLMGILIVSLKGARGAARNAADTQLLSGIQTSISSFRTDHRFLPPLVKDNNKAKLPSGWASAVFDAPEPLVTSGGRTIPNVFALSDPLDLAYLRGDGIDLQATSPTKGDFRFSEYSLAYYLIGALPATIDGVDAAGLRAPEKTGGFSKRGQTYASYFDVGNRPDVIRWTDHTFGRVEFVDSQGTPIRFYRWESGRASGSDIGQVKDLNDRNVPWVVAAQHATLKNNNQDYANIDSSRIVGAGYAIVSAGGNRTFGDFGTESSKAIFEGADVPVTVDSDGNPTNPDVDQLGKARELGIADNLVQVGDR